MFPILTRLSRPGNQVLGVGCGCGHLSLELARSGRQVTGVDVASAAIEQAKRHAERLPSGAPDFVCVSGLELPFPSDSFDLVFSVEVLEHLHEADVPRYLAGAFRVLRPGGRFWVQTPNRLLDIAAAERFGVDDHSHHHGDGPNVHLKEWTYGELMPLLDHVGFRDLTSFWQRPLINFFPRLPARLKLNAEQALGWLPFTRVRRLLICTRPESASSPSWAVSRRDGKPAFRTNLHDLRGAPLARGTSFARRLTACWCRRPMWMPLPPRWIE